MSEEKKTITNGKWMGFTSFVFVILCLLTNFVIIIMNLKINIEYLYKIDLLVFGVFSIVWSAVFGSSAIKKFKIHDNVKDKKD